MSDLPPALDELDRLLEALPNEDESPLLSELDAFLAGLLISPEPVPDDEWLPIIWGGGARAFPYDAARSSRLVELVLERKAAIAGELFSGGISYRPLYDVDTRHDETLWEIWIEGFERAMALRPEAWSGLLEHEDEDLATAFLGLMMLVGVKRGVKLTPKEKREVTAEAPDLIPYLVETVYRRQHGLPRVVLDPGPDASPPPTTPKVGRNDPCPCGSGRKFKKCCGEAPGVYRDYPTSAGCTSPFAPEWIGEMG